MRDWKSDWTVFPFLVVFLDDDNDESGILRLANLPPMKGIIPDPLTP